MRKDYSEYINKQIGELTILSISDPLKELNYNRLCKCKCSCGKEIETRLISVLRGKSQSCGHISRFAKKDYSEYVNKQFGELTILSISEPIKALKSNRRCTCKCSCGKEVETSLNDVLRGSTTSCGHVHREKLLASRNQNSNCRIDNKSTGIKNISFNRRKNIYKVCIQRKGAPYRGYASSLAEAIKIKERILQDLGELD